MVTNQAIARDLLSRKVTFGIYEYSRDTSRLEPYRKQIEKVGYAVCCLD